MINILVCDDEQPIIEQTTAYLKQVTEKLSLDMTIATFLSGQELLAAYQKRGGSLILLDIEMTGLDGLAIAKRLTEDYSYTGPIIFLTNHEKQFLTNAERGTSHLLEKPVDYAAFEQLLTPLLKKIAWENQIIQCQTLEGCNLSLSVKDILLIQARRSYRSQGVLLKTPEQEYVLAASLDQLEQQLAGNSFCRINQQLVNLNKVIKLDDYGLLLSDGVKLKLHRKDKKTVQEQLFQLV